MRPHSVRLEVLGFVDAYRALCLLPTDPAKKTFKEVGQFTAVA